MSYYKYPLQLDQDGKPILVTMEENIKDCLKLLLLEHTQERPLLVNYGSTISDYVFENITTINFSLLKREIMESIWLYEKRISDIEINTSVKEEVLLIRIHYKVIKTEERQDLQMKLNLR